MLAHAILVLFKIQKTKTGKSLRKYSFSRVGFVHLTPFWWVLKWRRGSEQDGELSRSQAGGG